MTIGHTLTGLDSGALVLAGGLASSDYTQDELYSKDVYLLKNDAWTLIGQLEEVRDYIVIGRNKFV